MPLSRRRSPASVPPPDAADPAGHSGEADLPASFDHLLSPDDTPEGVGAASRLESSAAVLEAEPHGAALPGGGDALVAVLVRLADVLEKQTRILERIASDRERRAHREETAESQRIRLVPFHKFDHAADYIPLLVAYCAGYVVGWILGAISRWFYPDLWILGAVSGPSFRFSVAGSVARSPFSGRCCTCSVYSRRPASTSVSKTNGSKSARRASPPGVQRDAVASRLSVGAVGCGSGPAGRARSGAAGAEDSALEERSVAVRRRTRSG